MTWQILIEDCFVTKDGRGEVLYILRDPDHAKKTASFYVGAAAPTTSAEASPRFNDTSFYYNTEDEALAALVEMRTDLQ